MRKKLVIKGQEGLNLLNPNGPTTITIPSTFTGNIDNISSPSSTFSNISLYCFFIYYSLHVSSIS